MYHKGRAGSREEELSIVCGGAGFVHCGHDAFYRGGFGAVEE
jgi:hypothetical protein